VYLKTRPTNTLAITSESPEIEKLRNTPPGTYFRKKLIVKMQKIVALHIQIMQIKFHLTRGWHRILPLPTITPSGTSTSEP